MKAAAAAWRPGAKANYSWLAENLVFYPECGVSQLRRNGSMNVADAVVNLWMDTPAKRDNLMNPQATDIGASAVRDVNGVYWTVLLAAASD